MQGRQRENGGKGREKTKWKGSYFFFPFSSLSLPSLFPEIA
jgi:hypothetical protein